MSEDVKPALTPAQWAAREVGFEYWGQAKLHSDGALTVRTIDPPAIFRGADRHALAALALHGQPFGFTRDDVALLRETAGTIDRPTRHGQAQPDDPLRLLADRIAALLPPDVDNPVDKPLTRE